MISVRPEPYTSFILVNYKLLHEEKFPLEKISRKLA